MQAQNVTHRIYLGLSMQINREWLRIIVWVLLMIKVQLISP